MMFTMDISRRKNWDTNVNRVESGYAAYVKKTGNLKDITAFEKGEFSLSVAESKLSKLCLRFC